MHGHTSLCFAEDDVDKVFCRWHDLHGLEVVGRHRVCGAAQHRLNQCKIAQQAKYLTGIAALVRRSLFRRQAENVNGSTQVLTGHAIVGWKMYRSFLLIEHAPTPKLNQCVEIVN